MDESLYDEFGTYIGPLSEEEDEEQQQQQPQQLTEAEVLYEDAMRNQPEQEEGEQQLMPMDGAGPSAVILHEDKRYYPSAAEVYGQDVETMVQDEDTQPLSEPIVAPIRIKRFAFEEGDLPPVSFPREFMRDLMSIPSDIRNIAIAGHLHHGKTAFIDMLVTETHGLMKTKAMHIKKREQVRYTDASILERERGVSIKAAPISLVLPSVKGKSYLFNMIDTPGHVNFVDEVASALRIVDGIVLVVDVVEGVQVNTENIVRHAVSENIAITLVVNKIDRLILELKLPPADAYFKIRHTVEQVNTLLSTYAPGQGLRVSPERGNVCFASTANQWCFSLSSFAKLYSDAYPGTDPYEFARRLWGDVYYDAESRRFVRKAQDVQMPRTFVHFILEPLYKLHAHTIGEDSKALSETLKSLRIFLKPRQYKQDVQDLLKDVCRQFFGASTGFVDMVTQSIPSPHENAPRKIERIYTGPMDTIAAYSMKRCDADGPLMVHTIKMFPSTDGSEFYALGRVWSGTIRKGQALQVLGEAYTLDDEEDMIEATVSHLWISNTRYKIPVEAVPAGNYVLIGGIGDAVNKTATLVASNHQEDAYVFRPVQHFTESVFKVAVEPLNPSELPKMLDGLRKINKTYPLATTKVEESGEHVVLGTGELYMDCIMYDLRKVFAEIDIKISNPVTRFCETVVETSAVKCYALTPNKRNKITMVAEPLDTGIAEDIEAGHVNMSAPPRQVGKFFEDKYGWDILASRSIWAFGPDDRGPNLLQDDTLPSEVDKKLLNSARESLRQGFQWGAREGPLCEEPMRNTRFKLTDIALAEEPVHRGGGQIIPTARRCCYSSFLMASPRLMEPIFQVSMIGPADSVNALYTLLAQRRGHVIHDSALAGTPLYSVRGLIPAIDSFGFESDLRIHTQGLAMCSLVFDRWQVVPGDPLDKSIILRPLEPANAQSMARDFVIKTRRRKGLSEDVTITKYLDEELVLSLVQSGLLDR